jgi:hypothetical protein
VLRLVAVQRFALGMILVAVGCGTFNEPIPAPEPEPAPTASSAPPVKSADPASSEAATEPPLAGATAPPSPGCKVGFQKDIMPKLVASCAQASCHGSETNRPFIEEASAQKTHEELMEFEFGSIEWSDPHADYSGASESDFKKAIDAWRICGAKLD